LGIRESIAVSGRVQVRFALRSLMRISGRSFPYRVGRLLMSEARFDVPNDPACNGEREVQATVLRYGEPGRKTVVFDVGANVGDWTCALLEQAAGLATLDVHAFEPCSGTYDILLSRIGTLSVSANVVPVRKACSSSSGAGSLHVVGVGAGTNSLTCAEPADSIEQIELVSIDDYCRTSDIDHVSLLKIDAEGHDIEVIKGATRMLKQQNIEVLQFEYNQRWIFNSAFLRDVFNILSPWGYRIGKVTPYGVEFYESWDWELETFREGNYLACLPSWINRFTSIAPSWNPRLLAASRNS
jgi:FkbM family methyltransferase